MTMPQKRSRVPEISTQQVQGWFCAAAPHLAMPPREACEYVADVINATRRREEYHRARKAAKEPAADVLKYGKQFLHDLMPLRRSIAAEIATREAVEPAAPPVRAEPTLGSPLIWRRPARLAADTPCADPIAAVRRLVLAQIDEAGSAVEELLTMLAGPQPSPNQDPIRIIATAAQEAWGAANAGYAPSGNRGADETDPLVKFVGHAFAALGDPAQPGTIRDVLRWRRRT